MNKIEMLIKLSNLNLIFDDSGVVCEEWDKDLKIELIDATFFKLSNVHAVIFAKIIAGCLRLGELKEELLFTSIGVKGSGFDHFIFKYIEELSEILPISVDYRRNGPVVRCDSNYLSAIAENRPFITDFDNKPFIEVIARFNGFYASFKRRNISLSYFKMFLRQRIMITNNIKLSHKLQFFTVQERFVYLLLNYSSFRKRTNSIYLNENSLYDDLNLLGFDFTTFSSDFLDVVDVLYNENGQLEGFSQKVIIAHDSPNIISDDIEKTLRIIKYDLFAANGPGILKMGVVCRKETFQRIIDFVKNEPFSHFHVRLTRFLLLDGELSEAFLKSVIIDIKSFAEKTYSNSRRFVVLSDFEAVFRFAKGTQLDYLYHFASELFSLSCENTTLIIKANNFDLYDTDVDYHIESDEGDYSEEEILKKAAEREAILNSLTT